MFIIYFVKIVSFVVYCYRIICKFYNLFYKNEKGVWGSVIVSLYIRS